MTRGGYGAHQIYLTSYMNRPQKERQSKYIHLFSFKLINIVAVCLIFSQFGGFWFNFFTQLHYCSTHYSQLTTLLSQCKQYVLLIHISCLLIICLLTVRYRVSHNCSTHNSLESEAESAAPIILILSTRLHV